MQAVLFTLWTCENYSPVVFTASIYSPTSSPFKGETNFSSLEEESVGREATQKPHYADEHTWAMCKLQCSQTSLLDEKLHAIAPSGGNITGWIFDTIIAILDISQRTCLAKFSFLSPSTSASYEDHAVHVEQSCPYLEGSEKRNEVLHEAEPLYFLFTLPPILRSW